MTVTLYTLGGVRFASKFFPEGKSYRRWIDKQELKYGACLRMIVE